VKPEPEETELDKGEREPHLLNKLPATSKQAKPKTKDQRPTRNKV